MDAGGEQQPPNHDEQQRNAHVDNAIRAIRQKKPLPEIDFTIHTMEDGTQVNTTERVCKGTLP
jgi:serine/threonine-protein phosphatase 2B catalytic subunit